MSSLIERLGSLQLLIVTGKGGVGKTTLTAALGRLLTSHGRRVLLIEMDPRESLHHLLDVEPSDGEIVDVGPLLALQHLEPRRVLDDLIREKLKVGPLVRRVLASPVHQHFTEGAPGLKHTGVFGRILRLVEGHGPRTVKRPDIVILDAPATGHGVQLMAAPQLVAEVIRSGPIGAMATEIAAFMHESERCGVVAVTVAEEIPVQETLELLTDVEDRLGYPPKMVIVNGLYPPLPADQDAADDSRDGSSDPAMTLWRHRRRINERELARLGEEWDGAILELPLLPIDRGPALVGALGTRLGRELRELG